MNKVEYVHQLTRQTAEALLSSPAAWEAFLQFGRWFYKYPFNHQLMIYAQRPGATACASYELWNQTMRRYVRRGNRGIALIYSQGQLERIGYVFDVADTVPRYNAREFYLWSLEQRHIELVEHRMAAAFGWDVQPLPQQIQLAADLMAKQHLENFAHDIRLRLGSSLEPERLQRIISSGIVCQVLSRCCPNESVHPLLPSSAPELWAAGIGIQAGAEQLLRLVEQQVKYLIREEKENGTAIQTQRGLLHPRPETDGGRTPAADQVWSAPVSVPEGASSHNIQLDADDGGTAAPPAADSGGSGNAEKEADGKPAGSDPAPEPADRPAGLGDAHDGRGRGSGPDRAGAGGLSVTEEGFDNEPPRETSQQLTFFPSEQEQIARIDAQEEMPEEQPVSIPIDGAWTEFPNAREAEAASLEEYKAELRRNARNFQITSDRLGEGGPKAKAQANLTAIRLLKYLEENNQQASPEQQQILSRYVGWGGLADAFDPEKSSWAAEYAQLEQLLTVEEYESARSSTLNAHYTSPVIIRAMYQALENMGFSGGKILEPACGVGHFFGMLPETMAGTDLYGVELDSISGRIAGQLYPQAHIQVAGFETTNERDFYDVAIGNVPFGQYQVNDRAYNQLGFSIHNYFFAKSLDQIRPGGIVAFISSRYTMDAKDSTVRRYLAQRAELLGAIRLPNNAFKAIAGTEVVSDILFLQKRERLVGTAPDWTQLGQTPEGYAINRYFIDHPEMVLGTNAQRSTAHGMDYTVEPTDGADLSNQLAQAIQGISGTYTPAADAPAQPEERPSSIPADPTVKNFSYTLVDGALYYRKNTVMTLVTGKKTLERTKAMVELRTILTDLITAQMEDYPEGEIRDLQNQLGEAYDRFTDAYGVITSRTNAAAFEGDTSYYLLSSLEKVDGDGKVIGKADIFTQRTIRPTRRITHADTPVEALAVSLSQRGRVDLPYMAALLGNSDGPEEVAAALTGMIFPVPELQSGEIAPPYVTAEEYLSGNVRHKLAIARLAAKADERYQPNVKALEKALPEDLQASEIDVRLGAVWIPAEYIQQFALELFEPPSYLQQLIDVIYVPATGVWNVEGKNLRSYNVAARETYGTGRVNGYEILEDTLNLRDVQVYDLVQGDNGKDKRVLNRRETMLAQQKQQSLKDAFRDWIWKDPQRRRTLVRLYNDRFNAIRPRVYDGRNLVFHGMNQAITLRPHQLQAIARIVYGGNTLLAHEVGAGKSFEMIAACMESKHLGLCSKAMFVVPNHLVMQWGTEFLRLYPGANILVTTQRDFETAKRKTFCARIATGDYDAIIIGQSQFERIPISQARQERLLRNQIQEVKDSITQARSGGKRFTVKSLERLQKQLEIRLSKLAAEYKKDDVVTFEQLGVDRLFVDESQAYKNLFVYTKMHNIAGLSTSESQRATDMYNKCLYMDELTGGRGVIFASGTPVSNSMTELYSVMRYLQGGLLKSMELTSFDAWASTFGETVTALELAPEGKGYRARTRFARFYNLPELMAVFQEAADIKTADQLSLPVPEARFHTVVAKPTEHQKEMVESLSQRASDVHNRLVDPSVDNMLKITSDGRKLGLDQRLINPLLPDEPQSKLNQCVANILRIWQEGVEQRLTQLVFSDMSTPGSDFNIYDDIRSKLIAAGVPEEEIAFIHNANTEAKKKELFRKVSSGTVRILLGSTQKMGTGTNVQERLIALHHLDVPWRPSDMTQRNGRIIRQGNTNPSVDIYQYVTEGTFDAYLFQTLENKQRFISQIMTSKSPARSCEDVDEQTLSYAEIKALCADNPLIKEKIGLDMEVAQLKELRAEHMRSQHRLQDRLEQLPKVIEQCKEEIAQMETDIQTAARNPQTEEGFCGITLKGRRYATRAEGGKGLLAICQIVPTTPVPIGSYRGFTLKAYFDDFSKQFCVILQGELPHETKLGTDPTGSLVRMDNTLAQLPNQWKRAQQELQELYSQQKAAMEQVGKPWDGEAEYAAKMARLVEVNALLEIGSQEPTEQRQPGLTPEQAALVDNPTLSQEQKEALIYGLRTGCKEDFIRELANHPETSPEDMLEQIAREGWEQESEQAEQEEEP